MTVKGNETDTQKKGEDTTLHADKDAKQEPASELSPSTASGSTPLSSASISSLSRDEVVIAETTIRETLSSPPAADSHTAEITIGAVSFEGQQHVNRVWSGLEWSVLGVVPFLLFSLDK